MRRLMIISLLFVTYLLVTAFSITAQDTAISYGDIVTGEITNQNFEVEYLFDGTEGDVIVVKLVPVETLGELSSPEVLLLNSDGNVIADTSRNIEFSSATLTMQLPTSDSYTIIATRADGRAGDSVGEYTLELIKPEIISFGTVINGSVSSEGRPQYFTVIDTAPLTLNYTHIEGELLPEVGVNILSAETPGGLEELAVASGDAMTFASLGIFTSDQPYIITVERSLFTFSFDEITADFALTVEAAE